MSDAKPTRVSVTNIKAVATDIGGSMKDGGAEEWDGTNPVRPAAEEAPMVQEVLALRTAEPVPNDPWPLEDMARACLRARKYDPKRGGELLNKFIELRREVSENDGNQLGLRAVEEHFRINKLRVTGARDRQDHFLANLRFELHDPSKYNAAAMMKLVVATYETGLRALYVADPSEREAIAARNQCNGVVMINDVRGVGFKNLDPAVPKALFNALSSRMPVRLRMIYIVEPPFFMRGVLSIIKMLMSKKLASRITPVTFKEIKEIIPEDSRVEMLDGTVPWNQDAYLDLTWPKKVAEI